MLAELRDAFRGQRELSYLWGVVLVGGAGVLFSFTALLFRGVENATDWQFVFYRGAGTALAMTLLIYLRRHGRPVDRASLNRQSVLAGLLMGSMSMLYILALARVSAATVTFLLAAGPFFGALFGWALLRERVDRNTWVAMTIAGCGVAIMVGAGLGGGSVTGLILAAAIPVLLGMYNTLIRSAPASDPLVPAAVGAATIVVVAGAVAFLDTGLVLSLRDTALGLLSGGVLLGIGLPLFNLGHHSVPTAQVSLLLMTEIVLTPVWVWIWPGETPSVGTLLGGLVVLAAVIILTLRSDDGRRWLNERSSGQPSVTTGQDTRGQLPR